MAPLAIPAAQQTQGQYLFVQVSCLSNDDQYLAKQAFGLLAACLGLAMVAIYTISVDYVYAEANINAKKFNLENASI